MAEQKIISLIVFYKDSGLSKENALTEMMLHHAVSIADENLFRSFWDLV